MAADQAGNDEIERLLAEAQQASGGSPPPPPPKSKENSLDSAPPQKVTLDPSELDSMLSAAARAQSGASQASTFPVASSISSGMPNEATDSGADRVSQDDIELLLNQAEAAIASIESPVELPPGVSPFQLDDFGGTPASTESATLELVRDVELDLKIELGRTHMHLQDVLRLRQGAVVPLDKLAGDPVDLYVNGRMIARGEVLVLNDNFCVRVTELVVGDSACA